MSSLLDIGCLFLLALIIGCIATDSYLKLFLIIITVIYYLIGSGILGYLLAKPLLSERVNINACKNTNGIILLGAGLNDAFGSIEPSLGAYDRVVKTAQIYNKYPQKIIISGGSSTNKKVSEAEVYAEQLYKLGIPKIDIILEKQSLNTYQNAKFTKQILSNDQHKYCLVTGGIHYRRAKIIFDKFNISTISIASSKFVPSIKVLPSAYNFYITQRIIHEYLGIARLYL